MPFMSPSACFTAWPSEMPTSSVVWCWSMCRSPFAFTVMSMRAWRASRSSMWSRKPMPVEIDDAPVPSRSIATSMSVSLVVRLTEPLRMKRAFRGARVCARLVSRVCGLRYCSTIFELFHRSTRNAGCCPSDGTVQAPDFALRLVRVSGTFMKYEWDAAKASANLAKHDVSFDDAARALEDPRKIEFLDDRFDYGEERMQSICIERDGVLFVVVLCAATMSAASSVPGRQIAMS